jgi:hypothetical protein
MIGLYDKIALYALSSLPCENTFSVLRSICKGNNSIDATTTAIHNVKLLEIAILQTGEYD